MSNFATATVEGNVTRDPESRMTKNGKKLCTFSIAVNHYTKNDNNPQVSYIDVETWEKLADYCSKTILKGKKVLVVGTLKQDRWEGEDGKSRSKIKIVGKEIRFIEFKSKKGETSNSNNNTYSNQNQNDNQRQSVPF